MRAGWMDGSRVARLVAAIAVAAVGTAGAAGESRVEIAARGMVVSQQEIASRVGVEVLQAGGNAVDAAVATALALAVVFPEAGNLGGGGFLLYSRARDSLCTVIDFRETAPAGARPDMYLDHRGEPDTVRARIGHSSVAVPGTPAGLYLAWSKYGRASWRSLVAPAIRLANDGFRINAELAGHIKEERDRLRRFPATAEIFLPRGKPLEAGDRLVQKDLARTLRLLAQSGALTFYEGAVADLLVKEMDHGRGIVGREDLARYRAVERPVVRGRYRDLEILVPPPPSSGGVTLLEILAMLEYYDLSATGSRSVYRVHLTTEAMARAFADRNTYLEDPDFARLPLTGLLSRAYIASRQAEIRMDVATLRGGRGPGDPWRHEPGTRTGPVRVEGAGADTLRPAPSRGVRREGDHTTHLSVVDAEGNAVALTTTLNAWFGSGVVVRGAGFLLNDEMDDFVTKPGAANQFGLVGTRSNAIAPGKRMLSSMTPAIVRRNGRPWLVLGSPGGPRIISTVLNLIVDVRDHGLSLEQAVATPRFHHQDKPDVLYYEPGALSAEVLAGLRQMGHDVRERRGWWSSAQCIEIAPDGTLRGVSDPRSQGAARGY